MSRPTIRRPHRVALAALGLTVVLGACGGSSGSGSADGGSPKTTKADTSSSESEGAGTPLEQLLSGNSGSQRAVEDAIASCMRERGWQYTPNPQQGGQGISFNGNDPAFREKYGYGISTQPPPEAFGGTAVPLDGGDDPYGTYQQTLSEADRNRYQKDLFGAMPVVAGGDDANANAAVPVEMDANSCMAKAQAAVAKQFPEMSEEFGKRLSELMNGLGDDPRMKDAARAWSACMAKANFTYDEPDDVFADLSKRAGELGAGGGFPSDSSGSGASGGGLVVAGAAGVAGQGASPATTLSAADQERVAKLQAEERAIAKADTACAKGTIDNIRPALEQEVVDKLRSEFPGVGSGK